MSKYDSSILILLTESSNDDMPQQKQNIFIGNATRILNEHPILFIFIYYLLIRERVFPKHLSARSLLLYLLREM
jgi:hypothetical protein